MFGVAGKSGLMESGTSINLGHMYHADTFLNALRQQTARALDESMDNLRLVTTWDASYNPGHNLGASIAGLMLQVPNPTAQFGYVWIEVREFQAVARFLILDVHPTFGCTNSDVAHLNEHSA